MKIGVFTALFSDRGLDETLDTVASLGLEAVELGAGAYPGSAHLAVDQLLDSEQARRELLSKIADRNLVISALSVHGNPLHPKVAIAKEHHEAFVKAVRLAALLRVERLNGFSGCPGDGPAAENPTWVTCAWPDEYREVLRWQWAERVVPYWREQASLLREYGIKFCIEMHPGFVVYNNETLLRLREVAGEEIGANFDPSHLWWQGIDPLLAARHLGLAGALFHVHAKDTRIEPATSLLNGNLDAKSYSDVLGRSWSFRTVGYGHSIEWWKDLVSVLRAVGYDWVLSIEHEDALMSPMEGLRKAVDALRKAVISEPAGDMFWAAGPDALPSP